MNRRKGINLYVGAGGLKETVVTLQMSEKSQPTEEHRQAEKLSGTLFCPILRGTAWVSEGKRCSALFRDKGELFNRRSALFGSVNHPLCTFLHCRGLAQKLRIYRY